MTGTTNGKKSQTGKGNEAGSDEFYHLGYLFEDVMTAKVNSLPKSDPLRRRFDRIASDLLADDAMHDATMAKRMARAIRLAFGVPACPDASTV